MSSRRKFLQTGVAAAAGAAGFLSLEKSARGQGFPGSPPLTPFKDRLPIPAVHRPVGTTTIRPKGYDGEFQALQYEVEMKGGMHSWHADLPANPIWGYSGTFPGPTFEMRSGKPASVRFINNLPGSGHLFSYAIDPTLHGAQPGMPEVRTVVHLHGGKVLPDSDGHPEAWYTSGNVQTGSSFGGDTFFYPNDQPATTLWYHDHTIGITRLNVMAGLAGAYLIRDESEDALNLPKGQFEIPLVIQDKLFRQSGAIDYPAVGISSDHPIWNPDFFSDTPAINGKVRPFLEVEPKKYRFRIVNASNSRYHNLRLEVQALGAGLVNIIQIGADQGFLPAPVSLQSLLLGPGERADVIVDFAAYNGRDILLTNDAKIPFGLPFDLPFPIPLPPTPHMLIRVRRQNNDADTSVIPSKLPVRPLLQQSDATISRDITMVEKTSPFGVPKIVLLENKMWEEPVSSTPRAGSTEIWRFINGVIGAHPQHIHLAEMQVLDRQFFDVAAWTATGNINPMSPVLPPERNEVNAPKDTVNVPFASITRVLAKFVLPAQAAVTANQRFRYVHHCHILEHEDNEMMRPFDVIG
jgi:spore coat protein A